MRSAPTSSAIDGCTGGVRDRLHQFNNDQASCWNDRLVPELKRAGISVLAWKQLRKPDREFVIKFFQEQVDPLLTPVTLDPSHPFPRVLNKALCLAVLLRHKRKLKSGTTVIREYQGVRHIVTITEGGFVWGAGLTAACRPLL